MSAAPRSLSLVCAGAFALGVAAACGGDATGPSGASVTGVAGDNQIGPTGSPLEFPLSFVVLNSAGQPQNGVAVNWTVAPPGAVTFSIQNSVSNDAGSVLTNVTLGGTVGEVVISANVNGLAQAVTFHATAVSRCSFYMPHTFGTTSSGALTTADCNEFGYYTDFYEFSVGAQQGITATMTASFDTWLDMYTRTGGGRTILGASDDISQSNLNSRILAIVAPGTYGLGANTALTGVTGDYTLATAARPPTVEGCTEVYITFDVSFSDGVSTADCVSTTATGRFFGDLLGLVASSGQTIAVTVSSSVLDPALQVYRATTSGLVLEAQNDDRDGTTTDAFVSFPASNELYVIFATTEDSVTTGAYTITVGAATNPSARALPLGRTWRPKGWATGSRLLPLAPPPGATGRPLPGKGRTY